MTSKTKQKPEMTAHDEDGNEYNVEFMPISEIHPYANNPRAKSECFSRVRQAMEDGIERIAVANTFVHEDGIIEYQQLATLYHYRCHVLTVENRHCGHNIHNVQESRIDRMRKEFKVRL